MIMCGGVDDKANLLKLRRKKKAGDFDLNQTKCAINVHTNRLEA